MFRKIPLTRKSVRNTALFLASLCPVLATAQGPQQAHAFANDPWKTGITLHIQYEQVSICQGDSATLSATTNMPFPGTFWYDAPTGGKLLHIGSNFTVSPSASTVYYAVPEMFSDEGRRDSVTVTVSPCQHRQVTGEDYGFVTVPHNAVKLQLDAGSAHGELVLNGKEHWNGSHVTIQDIRGHEMQQQVLTDNRFRLSGQYQEGSVYIVSVTTQEGKVLIGKVKLEQ